MEYFAKIVELPETQVLFYLDEEEDGCMRLHQMLSVDGFRANVAVTFRGEDGDERAVRALANADEDHARAVLSHVRQALWTSEED